jgi:hypothetical protein
VNVCAAAGRRYAHTHIQTQTVDQKAANAENEVLFLGPQTVCASAETSRSELTSQQSTPALRSLPGGQLTREVRLRE